MGIRWCWSTKRDYAIRDSKLSDTGSDVDLQNVFRRHGGSMSSGGAMPESNNSTRRRTGEWASKLQLFGTLYKQPIAQNSTKWYKRFFIIKDGWLLYYGDGERRELEKRKLFNIHPKGALPLSACIVQVARISNQPFAFNIESPEWGHLVLAAESEFEREKWMETILKAGRVTLANVQICDTMIQQLESQGLQMAKEKQDVFDRLQSEVIALCDEKEKTEELGRVNSELEKEKQKMECFMLEIKNEYEKIKCELEDTLSAMNKVESERQDLSDTLIQQQSTLEELAVEKKRIVSKLSERELETEQLSKANLNLSQTKGDLQKMLSQVEQETDELLSQKADAEKKLHENEEWAQQLEEEKQHFSEHAQELKETIKDLTVQKEITESELKEEVMARLDAERRLQVAEISVNNLDRAVQQEAPNIREEIKEEMMVDVRKLKNFFENLAAEAKLDEDKPIVVKNTIHARKTIVRRVKTSKFEAKRRSCDYRNRSSSLTIKRDKMKGAAPVKRAQTTLTHGRSGIGIGAAVQSGHPVSQILERIEF